jgi:hypothetical protein
MSCFFYETKCIFASHYADVSISLSLSLVFVCFCVLCLVAACMFCLVRYVFSSLPPWYSFCRSFVYVYVGERNEKSLMSYFCKSRNLHVQVHTKPLRDVNLMMNEIEWMKQRTSITGERTSGRKKRNQTSF